jgi:saccharopine dehydrogenase (NAD+, L-lysine forming)
MKKLKVGVLRETKNPPDRRVVLPPRQARDVVNLFPNIELFIQPSKIRCFSDDEYREAGFTLQEDLSGCDILLGVKEVNLPDLIESRSYLFFSHTAKKQVHNRKLLQECMKKGITLLDHEYLTDNQNNRLVAFGRWAGLVGAYNALIAYGTQTGAFSLPRAKDLHDKAELLDVIDHINLPSVKILITGGGRVAAGAIEVFEHLKLKNVEPSRFLTESFDEPVFCQLNPEDYVERTDGQPFDLGHFFKNPKDYRSTFKPYSKVADIFIPCHYWDPESPVFITAEEMKEYDFRIRVIADVSCDLNGPIPSTIRTSTIADPFYGYDVQTGAECGAWDPGKITVMAVDNLPGELPRNASEDFGKTLIERVFPALFKEDNEGIIDRATITKEGKLTKKFSYLEKFSQGLE